MQRGQHAGADLAAVVRRHGAAGVVPARRARARRRLHVLRGLRRGMAVARRSKDLHRRPGRFPVRGTFHRDIPDPSQDFLVPDRAPQTPDRTFQRDQPQTR